MTTNDGEELRELGGIELPLQWSTIVPSISQSLLNRKTAITA
jgi:hypothetical protein